MSKYIVHIEHDQDTESPLDRGDAFKLHSFCTRHRNFTRPRDLGLGPLDDYGEPKIESISLRSKLRASTVWLLSYYEHGNSVWFLKGDDRPGVEFRWDGTRVAGLLVYEGKPSEIGATPQARDDCARAVLDEYTSWCNGDCYYYSIEDEHGHNIDSCGGFIGSDHIATVLGDGLTHEITTRGDADPEIDYVGDAAWIGEYVELDNGIKARAR